MFRKIMMILVSVQIMVLYSVGQVKYYHENKKLIAATLSYSQLQHNDDRSNAFGGRVSFTRDGRIGLGLGYVNSAIGKTQGIGLSVEGALLQPAPNTGVGINIHGAASMLFTTGRAWNYPTTGGYSTESKTIQTGALGLELYFRTAIKDIEIEPFIQFIESFSNVEIRPGKSSISNYSGGLDFILPLSQKNFLVLSFGAAATDVSQSSLGVDATFGFLLN